MSTCSYLRHNDINYFFRYVASVIQALMVVGLAGRENGGKAKNCRVLRRFLARYIGILFFLCILVEISNISKVVFLRPRFLNRLINIMGSHK